MRAQQARTGNGRHPGNRRWTRVTIARAFNHMGPRQTRTLPRPDLRGVSRTSKRAGGSRGSLSATSTRSATHRRARHVRAYTLDPRARHSGRPYNVCSGRAITIRGFSTGSSHARAFRFVSVDQARLRPNDVPLMLRNPARIQAELGWSPDIPLDQTLDDLLNDWRRAPA